MDDVRYVSSIYQVYQVYDEVYSVVYLMKVLGLLEINYNYVFD